MCQNQQQNLMPCPDCGRPVSRFAPNCIHCGRPLQVPMQQMVGTVAKQEGLLKSGCFGLVTSFLLLTLGAAAILIPVAGVVLGPLLMLGALAAPFVALFTRDWFGPCPVCGKPINLSRGQASRCKQCGRMIFLRGNRLMPQ